MELLELNPNSHRTTGNELSLIRHGRVENRYQKIVNNSATWRFSKTKGNIIMKSKQNKAVKFILIYKSVILSKKV